MKVVTPDFSKNSRTPKEQIKEMLDEHAKNLLEEFDFNQAVVIFSDEDKLMFLTNADMVTLNYLLDLSKQYVLLGGD